MHSYIFDHFLGQKKHEKIVAQIETRLTDLGLQGKNCHVGPLQNFKSIVKNELKHQPKTIVVIGNNATFNQLLNSVTDEFETTFGIIPVGPNNSLAQLFGIEDIESACNILSARLIETVDLVALNDYYFISQAQINNQGTIIEVNGKYTVEPEGVGNVKIVNLSVNPQKNINPKQGSLGVYININKKRMLSKETDVSFIQTNKIIVQNLRQHKFLVDDLTEMNPPAIFSIKPKAVKIIVGKNRNF